jgi:lipoate-protein ligase B
VRDLEEIVVAALGELGVAGARVPEKRGVWIEGRRKIASVGIAVEEWVAFHGFALNVATDLSVFERFRPCGFDGRVMTSIARETDREVGVADAIDPVVRGWESLLGALDATAAATTTVAARPLPTTP